MSDPRRRDPEPAMQGFGDMEEGRPYRGGLQGGETERPAQRVDVPATQNNALVETGLVSEGSTGTEDIRPTEFQMPGLRIVQSNSPQMVRNHAEYNPDAKAGFILNTATGEVWDGDIGLEVVVFARDYHYGEWIPRNEDGSGGGFRGMHMPDEPIVQRALREQGRFKKLKWRNADDEDVELVETGQLYVYYGEEPMSAEGAQAAYISLASTNMPTYTQWLTRHVGWKYKNPQTGRMREAPLWAYMWRLTTVPQSRGTQNWFTFKLDLIKRVPLESLTMQRDKDLFQMAAKMHESFVQGLVQAVQEERDADDPPF